MRCRLQSRSIKGKIGGLRLMSGKLRERPLTEYTQDMSALFAIGKRNPAGGILESRCTKACAPHSDRVPDSFRP